jgi:hypothetical protein
VGQFEIDPLPKISAPPALPKADGTSKFRNPGQELPFAKWLPLRKINKRLYIIAIRPYTNGPSPAPLNYFADENGTAGALVFIRSFS